MKAGQADIRVGHTDGKRAVETPAPAFNDFLEDLTGSSHIVAAGQNQEKILPVIISKVQVPDEIADDFRGRPGIDGEEESDFFIVVKLKHPFALHDVRDEDQSFLLNRRHLTRRPARIAAT